jgi:hypothetical protein
MALTESGTAFETGTGYGITPWSNLDEMSYDWYVPELMSTFVKQSLFYKLVPFSIDLHAKRTRKMVFTQPIDMEPDTEERELRGLWLPDLYFDTRQMEITTSNYGSKVQAHKYDDYIWHWLENGRKQADLRGFLRDRLGPVMVQTLDILARNAFFGNSMNRSFAGDATGFHDLADDDTFDPTLGRAIWLDAGYQPSTPNGKIPALISPSATYAVKTATATDPNYNYIMGKANPSLLLNFAVADFEDVTFAQHPTMVLWNCGTVLAQASIIEAVSEGDGSPDPEGDDKVDGVWMVGQSEAKHYIQLSSISDPGSDETGFKAGDIITLHRTRPTADAAMAVEDGVKWDHHANVVRHIHSVDYDSNRITLKTPILTDKFYTALGSGMYGWVTKARDVHASLFMKGPNGVVAGVTQPPQFYDHEPIDDRKAIWRYAWDAYLKYQIMFPERFEVHFHSGALRRAGQIVNL